MTVNQELQSRDELQRISTEQLAAAARVSQHWFARAVPPVSFAPSTAEAEG
jgi:hypothetical protein